MGNDVPSGHNLSGIVVFLAGITVVLATMSIGIVGRHHAGFASIPAAMLLIGLRFRELVFSRSDAIFVVMALSPFFAFWAASLFHQETYGYERSFAADPQFWLEFGLTSAVLVLGVLCASNPDRIARFALPIGLLAMFVWLTLDKFSPTIDATNPSVCRVRTRDGLPFTPAIVLSSFALLYFAVAPRFGRTAIWCAGLAITAAFVVCISYTAARGALAGLLVGCGFIGVSLLVYRQGTWLLRGWIIVAALTLGTMLSVAIDTYLGCSGVRRIIIAAEAAFDAAKTPTIQVADQLKPPISIPKTTSPNMADPLIPPGAPEIDPLPIDPAVPQNIKNSWAYQLTGESNIALRLLIWEAAVEHIGQKPFIGSGRLAEVHLVQNMQFFDYDHFHDHAHQQYLSWLIWFGLPGLCAGLLGIVAPAVAIRSVKHGQERIILFAGCCSVLPIALMFDSLMRISDYLIFQALFSAFAYVVVRQNRRDWSRSRVELKVTR